MEPVQPGMFGRGPGGSGSGVRWAFARASSFGGTAGQRVPRAGSACVSR